MDWNGCYIDKLVEQHKDGYLGDIMLLRKSGEGEGGVLFFENLIGQAARFEGTYTGEPDELAQYSVRGRIFSPSGHVTPQGMDVALGFYGCRKEHPDLVLAHVRCVDPRARVYRTVTWEGAPLSLTQIGLFNVMPTMPPASLSN